jgi:hypothetical protein
MDNMPINRLSPKVLVENYEQLRQAVLVNANDGSLGLALFLHHGMVAWIKAWSKYRPVETTRPVPEEKAVSSSLAGDLRTELTTILANILLASRQERVTPC